jgi:benzoyl-CoA reductase subunit C
MGALEQLRQVAREPAAPARAWKARGRKVVGYRCLYSPEEVITAAGMLPYPLYGTPEPIRLADAYFQACTCEYVRNVFDLALGGKLEFLDGLVLANTCDVVKRLCDIWGAYVEQAPVTMIANPQRLKNDGNRDFYLEELRRYRARMAQLSGGEITDDRLRDAIARHNETRSLLREIYALRRADPPPLSGAEALDLCMAASVLPREEANPLLRQALQEILHRDVKDAFGPRILVTGSILDHPALLQMIEEEGGVVVGEDLCNTMRTFWHPVEESPDLSPLEALWRFGNSRPWCACMHPTEARLEYLLAVAHDLQAEAVIYFNLKYCHPFLYEAPLYKKALEARGLPTHVLEVGHDMSGHGQLRTRIQAFIEMLDS